MKIWIFTNSGELVHSQKTGYGDLFLHVPGKCKFRIFLLRMLFPGVFRSVK